MAAIAPAPSPAAPALAIAAVVENTAAPVAPTDCNTANIDPAGINPPYNMDCTPAAIDPAPIPTDPKPKAAIAAGTAKIPPK